MVASPLLLVTGDVPLNCIFLSSWRNQVCHCRPRLRLQVGSLTVCLPPGVLQYELERLHAVGIDLKVQRTYYLDF